MNSVNKQMAKGAVWMVLFKFFERGISMVSLIILARLLSPTDFGLVAMATAVVGLIELLSAFGFDITLISNQKAEREHFDTVWTFNVIFGVAGAIILAALSDVAARFYNQPELHEVMYVLAVIFLVNGLKNVGVVFFRKDMEFHKEFFYLIIKKICTVLVTIPAAFLLRNYWALLTGLTAGAVASTVLSFFLHPYRPRFSLGAAKEIFGVSKWLFLNNLSIFFRYRAGDFLIGRLAGPKILGFFNVSDELASMPTTELVAPINRAIFPGYAKIKHDTAALMRSFLDVNALVTALAVPAGFGIAALANQVVPLLLGGQWEDTVPALQLLALAAVLLAVQTNAGYVLLTVGRQKELSLINFTGAVILAVTLFFSVQAWGLKGAALATLAHNLYLMPLQYYYIRRYVGVPIRAVLGISYRPFVAGAAMALILMTFKDRLLPDLGMVGDIGLLLFNVAAGVVLYAAALLGTWFLAGRPDGAERHLINVVLQKLGRPRPAESVSGQLGE